MVNAQEWLDQNYPIEKRSKIKELISVDEIWRKLGGKLNLSGFVDLEKLDVHCNSLTELDLSDCPKLKELDCSTNNLTTLDLRNNPQIVKINCSSNGSLVSVNANRCKSLRIISCCHNGFLNRLQLNGCSGLEDLYLCNNSVLEHVNWNSLNSKGLKIMDIRNCNFSKQDLSNFGQFVNLEKYW